MFLAVAAIYDRRLDCFQAPPRISTTPALGAPPLLI